MPLKFLLDTNVVSELTKPAPNPGVLQALARHDADCAIAAITLEELSFGCHRLDAGKRQRWLLGWLAGLPDQLPVLPYGRADALWLGAERARLVRAGRPAPHADGEIAAVAISHGLTLVTRNTRDFEIFNGLVMVDWHS